MGDASQSHDPAHVNFSMHAPKIQAHGLSPEHFQALNDCITRVLQTDIARQTYAQILDGAPSRNASHLQVSWDNLHAETCAAAFQAWDMFRDQFSLEMLSFTPMVLQAYQNASFKSQAFVVRLLELVATACHDIGIWLFKASKGGIRPLPLTEPPRPSYLVGSVARVPLPPTAFVYSGYRNIDAYPEGVAECVGYWVEFEIFGGVVLFDRTQSGDECKSAFIHPGGDWMIAELTESQLQTFLAFGISESRGAETPFPWKGERNARRIDPYESFNLNIYRDRYERRPPGRRRRDVGRIEDHPELMDLMETINAEDEMKKKRDEA